MKITQYCLSVLFRNGQMISSQAVNHEEECRKNLEKINGVLLDRKHKYLTMSNEATVRIDEILAVFVNKGEVESELTAVEPHRGKIVKP